MYTPSAVTQSTTSLALTNFFFFFFILSARLEKASGNHWATSTKAGSLCTFQQQQIGGSVLSLNQIIPLSKTAFPQTHYAKAIIVTFVTVKSHGYTHLKDIHLPMCTLDYVWHFKCRQSHAMCPVFYVWCMTVSDYDNVFTSAETNSWLTICYFVFYIYFI